MDDGRTEHQKQFEAVCSRVGSDCGGIRMVLVEEEEGR